MGKTKNREIYLDFLRIISVILVIFTHTGNAGSKLYIFRESITSLQRAIYIAVDVIRTINVPLFLMISGALLLGKKETIKEVFTKRVLRILLALILASVLYYCTGNDYYEWSILEFLIGLFTANISGLLWYLYLYLGMLLILPFLRIMVCHMQREHFTYFFVLSVIFKGVWKLIFGYTSLANIGVQFLFYSDAIVYPILGFWLGKYISEEELSEKKAVICCVSFFICTIVTTLAVHFDMLHSGTYTYTESYLMILTVPMAVCFFYIVRFLSKRISVSLLGRRFISFAGECTFGIYLISAFIQLKVYCIYAKLLEVSYDTPLLDSVVYVMCVWIICLAIIGVIRLLPGTRKILG